MNDDRPPAAPHGQPLFVERNRSVDIAKGIGIWLVVLGHVLDGLNGVLDPDTVREASRIFIYTFHMALFFILSGAYSRRSTVEPPYSFALRLCKSFVHPYLLWSVILSFTHHLMSAYTNIPVGQVDLLSVLYWPPAVMWFLYLLFLAFLILRATRHWRTSFQLLLAVVLCIGGYFLDTWLWGHLQFIGLFLLAARLGPPTGKLLVDPVLFWAALLVMAITTALAVDEGSHGVVGSPAHSIVYLPAAFAGPYLVLCISAWLDRISPAHPVARLIVRIFSLLGRRTMPIYVMHVFFTAGTRIVLLRLHVHDVWVLGLAATVMGLVIPVALGAVADRIGMSRMLGWPTASEASRRLSTTKPNPNAG